MFADEDGRTGYALDDQGNFVDHGFVVEARDFLMCVATSSIICATLRNLFVVPSSGRASAFIDFWVRPFFNLQFE